MGWERVLMVRSRYELIVVNNENIVNESLMILCNICSYAHISQVVINLMILSYSFARIFGYHFTFVPDMIFVTVTLLACK